MSTVSTSQVPKPGPDQPDPFRYGWRYLRVRGPHGTESFDQVPLRLEDVLHPETGDFRLQRIRQLEAAMRRPGPGS